jgi:hypothetical protein
MLSLYGMRSVNVISNFEQKLVSGSVGLVLIKKIKTKTLRRMVSSGVLCRVDHVRTDGSEELSAATIRVIRRVDN